MTRAKEAWLQFCVTVPEFMATSCKVIQFVTDSFMAESYLLRERLSLSQFYGFNKFILQFDNLLSIDTMLAGGHSSTSSSTIFYVVDYFCTELPRSHLNVVQGKLIVWCMRLLGTALQIILIVYGLDANPVVFITVTDKRCNHFPKLIKLVMPCLELSSTTKQKGIWKRKSGCDIVET